MGTLYETLGVKIKASQEDIKNAYRTKAKKTHPDKVGVGGNFTSVASAYAVLSDPKKRKRYDETGLDSDISSSKQQAGLMLSSIFNDILEKVGVENILSYNVIGVIEKELDKVLGGVKIEKKATVDKKKKLEKVLIKIKHKQKNNLFSSVINQRLYNLETRLKSMKQQKEIVDIAKKLLKDYDFKFDIAVVEAGAWSNTNISTSSMFTVTL